MIPVYQTIFHIDRGNCFQATLASLFDIPLEEAPNLSPEATFNESTGEYTWFDKYWEFIKSKGYKYIANIHNAWQLGCSGVDRFKEIKEGKYEGVKGYFIAEVYSPTYFDASMYITNRFHRSPTHSVIVNKDLEIVHDPNPKYKDIVQYPLADFIGWGGILSVNIVEPI